MTYRTKTYIAADWSSDNNAVEQLRKWNNSDYWSLSFTDAHDLTQARDNSLNCSIKRSLKTRLDISKTFVLIVGSNTNTVRSGGCHYCDSYEVRPITRCARGYSVCNRSYIEYECEKAIRDGLKIVVLYNAASVNRTLCPESIRYQGNHVPMWYYKDGQNYWDYNAVKKAME